MESDYGIVDGFDEPPHAFIKSLLSKPIIVRKLADKFFGGDKTRVEDEYEALTEEELDVIEASLEMQLFSMGNTLITFRDEYYEYGGKRIQMREH